MLLIDQPVARWVTSLPSWLQTVGIWISEATSPVFVLPLIFGTSAFALLYAKARQKPASTFGVFCLCCGVAAVLSSLLVKNIIGRARPAALHGWDTSLFKPFAFDDAFASLPSTQAAFAAAVACSAAIQFPQYRVILLTAGALTCAARIFAGEHWPSDVIAGWALGWLVTLALLKLSNTRLH
ncbi:phosphatase PAP2 family protein [Rhizobium sp. CG5]|uniref:phosphatase PAP2 family protein n=1 Tax=Rhizobium sp. CG5 TaxID=2726076 RepID=UPI002034577F|nr:phosphatase PAP2 family protein [Rhizobium sp. CG5]